MGNGDKKIRGRAAEIYIIVNYYKEKAEELKENGNNHNDLDENWFECLKKYI